MLLRARKGLVMREFNTTGVCIPSKHYMVDLTDRVAQIKRMVDAGKYFVINRARQYGKTTTLTALRKPLNQDYVVLPLDFQGIGSAGFSTEEKFVKEFCRLVWNKRRVVTSIPDDVLDTVKAWKESKVPEAGLGELFDVLMDWCDRSQRGIVLIIDEVDSASNNQVFLDFLAQLREGYIARDTDGAPAFQSVILAGVTDVKHLKAKIRPEEAHRQNSPWNIATDFDLDMSLSQTGIQGMLDDYEADHRTGMDTAGMAKLVREYTNGYPFLVSRICQLIDQKVCEAMPSEKAWTRTGVDEAVKLILVENNALFQSLTAKLVNFPELKESLRGILMEGERLVWSSHQDDIAQMGMYGFIRNDDGAVRIDNRIFEMMLYNMFLSEEDLRSNVFSREGDLARNIFVLDGSLNMRLVLERFIQTYHQVFGPLTDRFAEKDGRELFLLYLRPIINGTGNYYIEAQTRDRTRIDVVVDYLGRQYVVELKIWRGPRYNADGERQIGEYLDYFDLNTGYMLSFNFNKHKEVGVRRVEVGEKVLYEGTL